MTTIKESVKYRFADHELITIARDQARLMSDMRSAEEAFDQIKADHKSKVTRIDTEVSDCTRRITHGYEMRTVECLSLKYRPDKDTVMYVRTDNGKVIRKRKLDADEKQLTITDQAPEPYTWQADYLEMDSDGSDVIIAGEHVQLTDKEAEVLRELVPLKPLRKMIGDGTN